MPIPQIGEIKKGYRFKGGNPNDKNNWEDAAPSLKERIGKAILPTAGEIKGEGVGPSVARVGMGTMELLDIDKRALAYITGTGKMSDPEANIWAKPRQIWRDYMDKVQGATEGTVTVPEYGLGYEAAGVEMSKKMFPEMAKKMGDVLFETIGSPILIGGILKGLSKTALKLLVKKVVEAPRALTGAVSRGLTKIPEETLTKYATKEGRRAMAKSYGREPATANILVRKIYKQKLPEEDLVETFISEASAIPIQPIIKTLEEAKEKIKFKKTNKSAIKAIDDLVDDYKEMGEMIPAKEFREMRKELDDVLGDVYEKEGLSQAQKAIKKARLTMKEELIKAAPSEYKNVMAEYARKLDARSDLKEILGKSYGWKARKKAEALLTGVERKGKTQEKLILEKFDDLYGTNFSKRAEVMHEARQIAAEPPPPGGKFEASLLPKVATGWGKLGVVAIGVGWPKTAGSILNKLESVTKFGKTVLKLPEKFTDILRKGGEPQLAQALAAAIKALPAVKRKRLEWSLDNYKKTKNEKEKKLIEKDINKTLR